MSSPSEQPEARRPQGSPWLSGFAWAALCALALGYLASLVPISFQPAGPPVADASVAAADAPRSPPKAPTDTLAAFDARLTAVQAALDELQAQGDRMAAVEAALDALQAQGARMEARLGELKDLLESITSAIPATGRAAGAMRSAAATAQVTVAYRPMPVDGFGDTGLDTSPVPIADAAPPSRTQFAVEIARGGSDLEMSWRALRALHAPLLDALEARVTEGEGGRRLLAGPLRNAADAALLCARLKSAAGHCRETVFDGDPL